MQTCALPLPSVLPLLVLLGACLGVGALPGCTSRDRTERHEPRAAEADAPVPAQLGSIGNVHRFGDVWLAGQPRAEDLALAQERGVRTVLNLRHESEIRGFEEPLVVTELGMRYVSLPWNGPDELTDDVFDRARAVLDTAERPLLLHCGSANRVGAVWIPWRVLDGGISVERAVAEAREIGLETPEYEAKAREYVARQSAHER